MTYKRFLLFIFLIALRYGGSSAQVPKSDERPNIVFILADDLGFEALGCYGGQSFKGIGKVRTPNLDALAAKGMRFTSCFASPVCSPARSEFLTGKYNFRTGFTDIAGRNGATERLDPLTHPTVATKLKAAGYITAVVGKWHVGPPESTEEIPTKVKMDTEYPHPQDCGFERQFIFGGAHLELYGKPTTDDYTPAQLQNWVLRFLESRKSKPEPFFLYYASPIPHVPNLPTPLNPNELSINISGTDSVQKKGNLKNFPYLIEYLDLQVGEVLKKLDELGLSENTIVLFSGDNGTHPSVTTEMSNGKEIRGGKASLLDKGSQVPLLAMWPNKIAKGSICSDLIDFSDLMPTMLKLASVPIPEGIDGVSFAEQLFGRKGTPREWVHTHFNNRYFVRSSEYKLREDRQLYSLKEAPYNEILIKPENETPISKAAREKLQGVMDKLYNGYVPPRFSKVESNIKSNNGASSKNKEENDH